MKISVAEYVFKFLEKKGVKEAFIVAGGAAAHLLNSLYSSKINYICNNHEQACAMSAEAYSRVSKKPAVVLVTNGPGSSNTLTGVVGAFQDSIPMIVISGQVSKKHTTNKELNNVRQIGVQELDIIKIVKSITKYSHQVDSANEIKYHLEKAWHKANYGRKGPIWLDIPIDIQSAKIETDKLSGYKFEHNDNLKSESINYNSIIKKINDSKRPLIVAGNGIHLANAENDLLKLLNKTEIPVISSWTAKDIFNWHSKQYIGNFGLFGERAANFAVQKADLLIVLGCRLSIPNIGYETDLFSPNSYKIMVDIDLAELNKKSISIDLKINESLEIFIKNITSKISNKRSLFNDWIKELNLLKNKYPVYLKEYSKITNEGVNSYQFIQVLSKKLEDDHIVVTDMGTSFTSTHQSLKTNGNNRLFTSSSCCSMGYGLPGGIGAYFAKKKSKIIVIAGDGGFQMNIQELQTVVQYNIPIKIFILNNNGYLAIKLMQDNLFSGNYIGSNPESGVSSPDFFKIAKAYGIKSTRIINNKYLSRNIQRVMNFEGPILCDINMKSDQLLIPRVQSSKNEDGTLKSSSLDNMYPFINEEELKEIMSTKS